MIFLPLPVVDIAEGVLVGIVTIDDALDVVHEESNGKTLKSWLLCPPSEKTLSQNLSLGACEKTDQLGCLCLMISATISGAILKSL